MATVYGLTPAGFVGKPQSVIKAELESSLQQAFGQNINLAPNSNFGQFVGIQSEREALVWQLAEAVYASQNPNGAEGTSVDNILALNNMRRKSAAPTRTNPTPVTQANGITLYGLVLKGTAGTVVLAGSLIETTASPPLQFALDAAVTIAAAKNAIQSLFMSNVPDSGAFQLSIDDADGTTLTTPSLPYNVLSQSSIFKFASVPVSGAYTLKLTVGGADTPTPSLPFNASASQIQTAIRTLSGYSAVTVTGTVAGGFTIAWGSIRNPKLSFNTNTTGVGATFQDSLQASFNALLNGTAYPFIDVLVSVNASGFNFTFAGTAGAKSQPLIVLVANTLQMGTTVTNINIVNSTEGSPAQGIGSASCTSNGPNFVAAGALSVVGTSVSGWDSVENQLDCITGSDVEGDTEALQRRSENLQAQANGPLASIVQKVRALTNVSTAIGFENLNEAALQKIAFDVTPVSGSYKLVLNGTPTSAIAYNASAAAVQAALRAISGYGDTLVSGDNLTGYIVDFNGSFGGQDQDLLVVVNNTTGSTITTSFGRPGKSFEIVAQGGDDNEIAQTILNSKPAGIQTYGSTTVLVYDEYNNPYNISFSRPTQVPVYIVVTLETDLTDTVPEFNPQSISTIQQDLVTIGDAFGIGGLVIGFGTKGLIGAFNDVPGIKSYTLFFDRAPNPTTNTNIQMQPQEVPVFETFNIAVSYT